jgi:hypothetical protein
MADVSVEFGATDVGLEKALQQIQTEMGNLQGKVKSGELSMEELEQTMRRIGQVENMEKRLKAMGDASAESSPKIKKLGDDIDTAGSSAQSVGGIFDAEFKKIAGAFTVGNLAAEGFQKIISLAFDAAQSVVQGFSDALDLGGRLNELSQRTGESAGKLLVLETAFKNSGLEASTVGTAINKLQNFMQDAANGGDKQRAAMQSLGVSMSDLAGKTPTEQMQVFADKIAGIEDPTARAAAASEVFGDKLGGKLLPLFSDFSTNLEDARAKVGSLEEVMDENAATFDAAAETIDAVKGKMAAFAAGVLSETIPALEDLGKSMEQVDAAGLGQDVGEFLSPRLEKLSFVTIGASEALKELIDLLTTAPSNTSTFGKAINAVAESLDGFNYYMQKAINFISPMDDLWTMLEQKGRAAADAQDTAAASIQGTGTAAQTATTGLKNVGTASDTATGKVDALGTSAQATGQNIASAFSLTSDFAPKLDAISGSWGGVNNQILGGKNLLTDNYNLSDSITGKVEEQAAGFGGVNEQLTTSKDLSTLIDTTYGSHAEKLEKIQEKQAKNVEGQRELVELETQLNLAKAAGNTELATALEKQLEQKKATEEIAKLTTEYQKTLGVTKQEAGVLATNFVNAKNAANSIGDRTVSVSISTKVDDARWKDLLASIAANGDPKSVQVAMQVTGKDTLSEAYKTLQDMETVQKNFTAAFTATGAQSIEEIKANLEGIPTEAQRQLALQITGEEDFDRAKQKLDSFAGTKEAKLLLKAQGFENMDAFQNQLNGIVGEKRTKLLLESLGLKTVEEAKLALDRILANNGKKAAVTVEADTTTAEEKINSLGPVTIDADTTTAEEKINSLGPVTIDADTTTAEEKINSLGAEKVEIPATIKIDREDFNQQLQQLQSDIKNSFQGGAGGAGGAGGSGGMGGAGGNAIADIGTLQTVVEAIKSVIEKIEPKLPTAALAA